MTKILLALLLLIAAVYTQCPANNQLQGLVSDFVAFNTNPSSQNVLTSSQFPYTFKKTLNGTPNVGFGIWDINIASAIDNPLNEFGVKVTVVSASSVAFEFTYLPRVWRSIRIGFWACSRSDIYLGAGNSNFGSLHSSISTQRINFPTTLDYQNPVARIFLNGFGVNAGTQGFQIQIEARDIGSTGFTLAVATGSQTDLKFILFSFLIFSPTTAPFASYGGSITKSGFSGVGYQDISNTIYSNNFVLQGLVRLGSSLNLNILTNLDNDFVLGFSSEAGSVDFVYAYVVVGVAPQSVCSHCSSERCAYRDRCVASCPENTYQVTFKDGGIGCRSCPVSLGKVYSKESKGCVCAPGYQLNNGACVLVDNAIKNTGAVITIYNNGQTQNSAAPIITTTNVVPEVVVTAPASGITVISTTSTSTSTSTTSSSSQSYVPSVPTPSYTTSTPTPTTPVPLPTVPTSASTAQTAEICANFVNTYWTGYRCSCRVGYTVDASSGQCMRIGFGGSSQQPIIPGPYIPPTSTCPDYQEWREDKCNCVTNRYRNKNGKCIIRPTCPENSYLDDDDECVCKNGYQKKNGNCVRDCPQNSYLRGDDCVCKDGYYKQNGVCVQDNPTCGANSQYNPVTKKCECKQGYIMVGTVCIPTSPCPTNQVLDPVTNVCKCKPGMGILANGQCGTCPTGFYVDTATQLCVQCRNGQVYQNGVCVCPTGQLMDANGNCYSCPINQIVSGTTCTCKPGYTRDPTLNVCLITCTIPYVLINGACGSCVPPANYDGQNQICVCPTGYSLNNQGICQPTSQCNSGYYQGANGCLPCTAGCSVCYSPILCLACQDPTYSPDSNGICVRQNACGNRIIQSTEQCDDGNTFNGDGCSSTCIREMGFTCTGNPSVCIPNSLTGINVIYTTNLIIITLQSSQYFIFDSAQTMTSFLQYVFPAGTEPNSGFCVQRPTNFYLYDCYFSYTTSAPTAPFSIAFSYNYNGATGTANVPINPTSQPNNPCGNRVSNTGQGCDDGNVFSGDGCSSSCQIETGWACLPPSANTPSICALIQQPTTGLTATNIYVTQTTVTITFQVPQPFTFANQQDMASFLQYQFPNGYQPNTGFCVQRSTNLLLYDCYFNYITGVPQTTFTVPFSYNRIGVTGSTNVIINPSNPVNLCGNRYPNAGEGCDDGNTINNDGCSSTCQVQAGWTCTPATISAPSFCTHSNAGGLSSTNVVTSQNSVVVTLVTTNTFTFANQQEMLSFIQYQFQIGAQPTAGICMQRNNNPKTFDCSFTYQNGVPQTPFTILFSYNKNGQSASTSVLVNPNNNNNNQGTGMNANNIVLNNNAVYVTLQLNTAFTFANQQEMAAFIQYQIPNSNQPSSAFCRQRPADLKLFDCLFNYPTGISKTSYSIKFSYSRNGINGNLNVFIDVNKSQISNRSLK